MGACQKQFHNVPDDLSQFNQQQLQLQRNRISSSAIKPSHRIVKPNNSRVEIGMIDTKLGTQYSPNNQYSAVYRYQSQSSIQNGSNTIIQQNKPRNTFVDIDRQRLHATTIPFIGNETVTVAKKPVSKVYVKQKQREPLDFAFYHSLALPQYYYRQFKNKQEYKEVFMCEQQERNGVKYIGEWKKQNNQNIIHGNGVLQSNVTKYIGQFRDGLKHYHGREIQKYQVYQGEFQNGLRKGQGVKYTPQSIESGVFDRYLKQGKIIYADGTYYEGALLNNLYHGNGQFRDSRKYIYKGPFVQGKPDGKGVVTKIVNSQQFIIYDGYFRDGLRSGLGQYNWSDKVYYNGQYLLGKKHGQGKLKTQKCTFTGIWKNGEITNQMQIINNKTNNRVFNIHQCCQQQFSETDGLPQNWKSYVKGYKWDIPIIDPQPPEPSISDQSSIIGVEHVMPNIDQILLESKPKMPQSPIIPLQPIIPKQLPIIPKQEPELRQPYVARRLIYYPTQEYFEGQIYQQDSAGFSEQNDQTVVPIGAQKLKFKNQRKSKQQIRENFKMDEKINNQVINFMKKQYERQKTLQAQPKHVNSQINQKPLL